jgi:O-antigen/teichoic acid export membrane protein
VNLVVYGLAKLGGTLALILLGLSVASALVVNAVATLAAILAVCRDVAVRGVRLQRSLALPLLRVALPIGLYAVLWQALSGADLWVLKGIGDEEITSVGRYVAARTVAGVLSLVPTAFSFALFTWLTKAIASGDDVTARRQVRSIMRFAVIIVVPVVTVLALNAEAIMVLVFSTQYASGAAFLALQAVGFGLLAFLDTLLHAVMAGGQRYRATLALGAVVLIAIGTNVLLAPAMGALGTGLALVVTAAAGTGAAVALAGSRFGVPVGLGTLTRVSLATVAVVVVNVGLHADGPWVLAKLVALFGTYAGVLAICRELRWNDLDAVVVWRATA